MELLFEAQNLVRSGVAVLGFLLWPYLLPILVGLLLFLCIPRLFPKNGNISSLTCDFCHSLAPSSRSRLLLGHFINNFLPSIHPSILLCFSSMMG